MIRTRGWRCAVALLLQPSWSRLRSVLSASTGLLAFVAIGCGPVAYTLDVAKAERVLEAARSENAAYYAPYDLQFAEAHLDEAHEEAAQGQYEDAIHAAIVALDYGQRAVTRAQRGHLDR